MQSSQDLGVLARTDPYQARLWAAMPLWAWISYGGAVLASTLGTLAMILRRRIAVLLSLVGLVAVLLQFGYTFLGTDVLQVLGFVAAAAFLSPSFCFRRHSLALPACSRTGAVCAELKAHISPRARRISNHLRTLALCSSSVSAKI